MPGDPFLDILTFHQLCHRLMEEAGIESPAEAEFFEHTADLALSAIERIGGQYDAILVDEGQVIDEEWWLPIEALLHDPGEGTFWVFFDDNQALYDRPRGLPDGLEEQPLSETWRNSRPIFTEVMGYYRGDDIECLGPDGPAVERVPANGSVRKELGRVLHRLVTEQQVRPKDIVVLTPRTVKASSVVGQVGAFVVTESPTRGHDIRLSSVYRFLGLEAKVVVVCEVPAQTAEDFTSLMYVALSRARALLVIIE
jgi:hypothetical protein